MDLDDLILLFETSSEKAATLRYLLGLTASADSCRKIVANRSIIRILVSHWKEHHVTEICHILINLSAHVDQSDLNVFDLATLVDSFDDLIGRDCCCQLVSNLSRNLSNAQILWNSIGGIKGCSDEYLQRMIVSVSSCTRDLTPHLAFIVANITQLEAVRSIICSSRFLFACLLRWCESSRDEIIRRSGVTIIRNCSLDADNHKFLLSEVTCVVPPLLLMLAGGEQLEDESERKQLPAELQYLPETKLREPSLDIRMSVLDILMQLCKLRHNRTQLRAQGVYLILRDYHKWESDEGAVEKCEDLVNILVRTEDEIGLDCLTDV